MEKKSLNEEGGEFIWSSYSDCPSHTTQVPACVFAVGDVALMSGNLWDVTTQVFFFFFLRAASRSANTAH